MPYDPLDADADPFKPPPVPVEVFCLHCLEGWSYQEIAEQCELSQGAVGVILHRARKQLQSQLATFYGSSRKEIR